MAGKNKILVIGTYPIKLPQHGGQKRLDAIVHKYKESGYITKYVSVFFSGFYSTYSSDDIPLGRTGEEAVYSSPMTGDIICGEAIYNDSQVKTRFTQLLKEFLPDIIHIEQPFPYLGLKPLLLELNLSPKIVFGSQNIEAPMKREILENYGMSEDAIADAVSKIEIVETDLARNSSLTVACTEADLRVHKQQGATRVVLAPNGVNELDASKEAKDYWTDLYRKMEVSKTAVFVGSAHPPNWNGFLKMIGKGLGFVPYDSRIVAAGSISDYFEREIKSEDSLSIEDVTFWLRAYSAGRLSEDKLQGIIQVADIILLPITEGGGSNLKTAEAIIADRKVVATNHALRSFEWFRRFPNVWVEDEPDNFRKAIVEALESPKIDRTKKQQTQAQAVLWTNCLEAMINGVKEL